MKILLAVDQHQASFDAAAVVSDWFADDAEVVALHVGARVPTSTFAAPVATTGLGYPVYAMPILRSERERVYLEASEIAERAASLTHGDARTESGDPATRIIQVATEIDADLIVIGTGDRSWLSRVFTPSVSDEVVHNAPCPVLVVRPAADEADRS